MIPPGTLFLVSTPIGHHQDITIRALRMLREADVVVYEERREGERLLARYDIRDKPIEVLNEHNEDESSSHVMEHLGKGRSVALVSDAGTPVVSDPGFVLVQRAIESGVQVVPVPGPSSIIPALTVSGFAIDRFVFCGFLSPKTDCRKRELHALRSETRTLVMLDTPYRLIRLLKDVGDILGGDRRVSVAFNLTLPDERIFRGTALDLATRAERDSLKGEFVLVVEGKEGRKRSDGGGGNEALAD